MSQRGPTSRPPSRSGSYTQSIVAHASPSASLPRQRPHSDGGADRTRDAGGRALVPAHEPARQATPRTIGVHAILNPLEPRDLHLAPLPSSTQRPVEGGNSPSSAGTRQYGVSGSPYQAYGAGLAYGRPSGPAYSPVPTPTSVPHSVQQQESPTPGRPAHPALGAARRILTPRSPRPPSFSRSATPSSYADPQPPLGFPPSTLSRQDLSSYAGPPTNIPQQSPRVNTASATPITAATRSFSQPAYSSSPAFQFPPATAQSGAANRSPQGVPAYPQGQYGLSQNRPAEYSPQSGSPREANLSTALFSALHTGGGGVRGSEVQPHLTLQTNTGEHITVPLDVHQGSRQADEKRHRNAGASARFRARKKERDKDMRETLQRLEAENREVSRHAQELQAERDFYRNERNRLRDLVLRTPEIREHAERGPPSPRSSRVTPGSARPLESSFAASFAPPSSIPRGSLSPMMQQQQQPPQQQQSQQQSQRQQQEQQQQQQHPPPYSGDLERPSRRRRTDPPAANVESAPYPIRPAQPPSSLPPIITQGITTPLGPGPPSARLPPLRFDQPLGSPTAAQTPGSFGHQPPGPPPLQTQFPPFGRPPHEAGWATGPREHRPDTQHRSPGLSGP